MIPAGVAAVERPRQRSATAWLVVLLESALLFALFALAGRGLGAWTPDAGVLVLLTLAVRGDARPLWTGAVVVSAARLAVGIDPPVVVLFGYATVALAHASLCAVVDPDRPVLRALAAAAHGGGLAAWLLVAHGLRAGAPGGLGSGLLGELLSTGLAAGVATGLAAFALVAPLRSLPGLRPRVPRRSGFRGPRWMRGVPAGRSA